MRFVPLSFATVVIASLTLTSCAGVGPDRATCVPELIPGSLTASTTVNGSFGTQPSVALPTNTAIQTSERAVLNTGAGQGLAAVSGDLLSINFAVFDGDSGNEIDGTPFNPDRGSSPVLVTPEFTFPGLYKGLLCAQQGDRLLLTIAPQDGLGEASAAEWGIAPDSTLVLVIDVVGLTAPRASGSYNQLPNGFPNVVSTETGQVGIVLPPSSPTPDIRIAEHISGTGPTVTADDVVFGQELSVDWATRSVLSSTWSQGSPTSFGTQSQGSDIRGFLTGYRVGSQLVMLLPSPSGATVHVVDLLAVG